MNIASPPELAPVDSGSTQTTDLDRYLDLDRTENE